MFDFASFFKVLYFLRGLEPAPSLSSRSRWRVPRLGVVKNCVIVIQIDDFVGRNGFLAPLRLLWFLLYSHLLSPVADDLLSQHSVRRLWLRAHPNSRAHLQNFSWLRSSGCLRASHSLFNSSAEAAPWATEIASTGCILTGCVAWDYCWLVPSSDSIYVSSFTAVPASSEVLFSTAVFFGAPRLKFCSSVCWPGIWNEF